MTNYNKKSKQELEELKLQLEDEIALREHHPSTIKRRYELALAGDTPEYAYMVLENHLTRDLRCVWSASDHDGESVDTKPALHVDIDLPDGVYTACTDRYQIELDFTSEIVVLGGKIYAWDACKALEEIYLQACNGEWRVDHIFIEGLTYDKELDVIWISAGS